MSPILQGRILCPAPPPRPTARAPRPTAGTICVRNRICLIRLPFDPIDAPVPWCQIGVRNHRYCFHIDSSIGYACM